MVDDIVEVMELIVTYLFTLAEEISQAVINLFYGIVFISILATSPIWIVPFLIWRRTRDK